MRMWGMSYRVGFLAIAALAVTLGGCGGGHHNNPPPPPTCTAGTITVAWDFVAGSSGCQPGDTVSVRVDNNAMVLHPNCTDMGVVTPALDPGTHTVDIALYDANNALIEASPVQNVAVCGDVSAGTYDFSS